MAETRLHQRFRAGEASFGGWCATPSSFTAELLAGEGFDYICVDCQHGLIGYDAMWPMLQAVRAFPATPVVRIPASSMEWAGKALDAGARAIIVPMVNNRDEAARAVAVCRYAPDGVRSFATVRASMMIGSDPEQVNREVLCLVMVETVEALSNVDAICSTPGVDGVYVGPADLAVSMGVPVSKMFEAPTHADAVDEIRSACERHGILPGIHTSGGAQARALAEAGYKMCTLATDVGLLRTAARLELAAARGEGHGLARSGPYG